MIPGWPGETPPPQARNVDEVRQVLAIPECPCSGSLYFMYRDLARTDQDRAWLSAQTVRYDVTEIPPLTLCGEYVKTKGHYHPPAPSGVHYPEVYEVLTGEAHYLLQNGDISDVVLIFAREGEKVIIPPGYGHVTINASTRKLLMANLVSCKFSSDYQMYEGRHGAAYYMMVGEQIVKNPHYPSVPPLRTGQPSHSTILGIEEGVTLYHLVEKRVDLSFLNHPERYTRIFKTLLAG
ncbi:MAG: glucose-6-phosphate isomerase [Methanomicrobiales archaeon]|nr:glucose-6-phosphate isomerase [Methanomicrobiales archaeon]